MKIEKTDKIFVI